MKTITGLRELSRGRVEVQVDGSAWRVVPADAVVRAGLRAGKALDRETARALGRELRRANALGRATRALAHRDRSRHELEQRLGDVPRETRNEAMSALAEAGLVDDARYARNRAAALAGRGRGDAAIRSDLEQRGVGDALVAEAIAALEPERERARRIVERRGTGPQTARWLAGRGFDHETVEEVAAGT